MNILSIIYSSISLALLLVSIITLVIKQWSLKSPPVFYFLGLEGFIAIWVICGLLQVIFSNPADQTLPTIFITIGIIANGLAMISTGLFASSLSGEIPLKQTALLFIFSLIGGVIAVTLSRDVFKVTYDSTLDISKSSANYVWLACLAGGVILAGSFLMWHVIRQKRIITQKHKLSINFILAGVVIAFYGSIVLYAVRYLTHVKMFLHLELVSTSIGTFLITVGMLIGGKTALYGTSRVISINIYDDTGINRFQGFFIKRHSMNQHLVAGVASAIATFASEIIGEEVFPREIDLGDYSLILVKEGKFVGFIACKYPSYQIHTGLRRIMKNYKPKMTFKEIVKLIDNFLPYGPPQADSTYEGSAIIGQS